MKYALILGLVLLVIWIWRSSRQASVAKDNEEDRRKKPAVLEKATEIVACRRCQVHLPLREALTGRHGHYCSVEHRQQADDHA